MLTMALGISQGPPKLRVQKNTLPIPQTPASQQVNLRFYTLPLV